MYRKALMTLGMISVLALTPAAEARRDEGTVTPTGFRITPAGDEIGVSPLASGFQGPLGSDIAADGRHVLSVSSGAARIGTSSARTPTTDRMLT